MCEPCSNFSLLDPFCGGGTIPLEASEMVAAGWGGADAAGGTLFGCDKSEVVVKGAQANCTAAGIKNVTFEHVGAQGVDRL